METLDQTGQYKKPSDFQCYYLELRKKIETAPKQNFSRISPQYFNDLSTVEKNDNNAETEICERQKKLKEKAYRIEVSGEGHVIIKDKKVIDRRLFREACKPMKNIQPTELRIAFQKYSELKELMNDGPHDLENELKEIEHKILSHHTRLAR